MQAVRRLLAQRHLASLICAAALLLKLLIPAGYMIANDHGRVSITICSGTSERTMTVDMPGMHGDMSDYGKSTDHGKAEMPCAIAGLSIPALDAIDPIQLTALIAFVLAVGLSATIGPAPSRLFAPSVTRTSNPPLTCHLASLQPARL